LARLNQMDVNGVLRESVLLRLPGAAPAAQVVVAERREETRVVAESGSAPEPVTESEARSASPSLAPGVVIARSTETIDYAISEAGAIRVATDETLGHYADWLNLPTSRLRSLNGLSGRSTVALGGTIRLDFSGTTREQFDAKRRAYHEALQAAFFAANRIVGTDVYVVRSGDSLWNVTQKNGGLPAWLVRHYNPDIDFSQLRAGLRIVIPRVEAVAAS
jgi:nucleoid-associated protein YgaU